MLHTKKPLKNPQVETSHVATTAKNNPFLSATVQKKDNPFLKNEPSKGNPFLGDNGVVQMTKKTTKNKEKPKKENPKEEENNTLTKAGGLGFLGGMGMGAYYGGITGGVFGGLAGGALGGLIGAGISVFKGRKIIEKSKNQNEDENQKEQNENIKEKVEPETIDHTASIKKQKGRFDDFDKEYKDLKKRHNKVITSKEYGFYEIAKSKKSISLEDLKQLEKAIGDCKTENEKLPNINDEKQYQSAFSYANYLADTAILGGIKGISKILDHITDRISIMETQTETSVEDYKTKQIQQLTNRNEEDVKGELTGDCSTEVEFKTQLKKWEKNYFSLDIDFKDELINDTTQAPNYNTSTNCMVWENTGMVSGVQTHVTSYPNDNTETIFVEKNKSTKTDIEGEIKSTLKFISGYESIHITRETGAIQTPHVYYDGTPLRVNNTTNEKNMYSILKNKCTSIVNSAKNAIDLKIKTKQDDRKN